jgi:hypothetical protein
VQFRQFSLFAQTNTYIFPHRDAGRPGGTNGEIGGRDTLRGDGVFNIDAGLGKR